MSTPAQVRCIATHDELINALTEAAALEHGVLVQYLFAAYSLKKHASDGLSELQVEKIREWARTLLRVAHQEMAHLGTVLNLLVAVGGRPQLLRREAARAPRRHFPFDVRLERFNRSSLERFISFEAPADATEARWPMAPDEVAGVGDFYGRIAEALRDLERAARASGRSLFVGHPDAQGAGGWTTAVGPAAFNVIPVTNLASALAAINWIRLEGEGASGAAQQSHYDALLAIRRELLEEMERLPGFEPARPVVPGPRTHPRRDGPTQGTLLETGTLAYETARLFNHVYGTVLLMLAQFYNPRGETPQQRRGLQAAIRQSMTAVLRPIAEVLTELPAGPGMAGTAGPPFEIDGQLRLAAQPAQRWSTHPRRMEWAAATCRRLGRADGLLRRLDFIATNLELLAANLRKVAEPGT